MSTRSQASRRWTPSSAEAIIPKIVNKGLLSLCLLTALAAPGCKSRPVYLNQDVATVLVLPCFMETIEPNVWEKMWPHVMAGVRAKGYQVVPAQKVLDFYDENRFRADPAEIKMYSAEELAKEFNVDGVFYSNITRWGAEWILIWASFGVEAEFQLVDAKGEQLWFGTGEDVNRSGGGLGEDALVQAALSAATTAFLQKADPFCHGCVRNGLRSLPLAGFDPKPEEDGTNQIEKPYIPETQPFEEEP